MLPRCSHDLHARRAEQPLRAHVHEDDEQRTEEDPARDRRLEDVEPFERLPQKLENVRISDRGAVEGATALWDAVEEENTKLEGNGRVLVRASGTEPLLRVMVEAPTEKVCDEVCKRLVGVVERELG